MNISNHALTGEWDDLTQRGLDICRIKAMLEMNANGRFVAIHIETGDFTPWCALQEALDERSAFAIPKVL